MQNTFILTFPQYSTYTDPTTGITYTEQYDIFTVGAGYLDIVAALNNTDLPPATSGSALSPTAVYNAATGSVYVTNSSSVVWGGSVVWGSSVVRGTSVIWGPNTSGQSVLWGSSAVWGSSTLSGFSLIWGTGVVWGTRQPAGESTSIAINGEK